MDNDLTFRLQRRKTAHGFTIGEVCRVALTGDLSDRLWYTGEDPIREIPGVPVSQWKIQDDTAIPQGRYRIIVTHSMTFKRRLPRLIEVPGFSGILIHPGNTSQDTKGCILPGMQADARAVWQSQIAFDRWYSEIETALLGGDDVWLEVRNP
jgi:hypothetical protein